METFDDLDLGTLRADIPAIELGLDEAPAVVLLGPRQVGKTTLALQIAQRTPNSVYLDLQSSRDRAKLADPELYLRDRLDRLVILDEVHHAPGLFPILRGLIDEARRRGQPTGRYLLLGSAALDLLKQSGETLAGRVRFIELTGFKLNELKPEQAKHLWSRGGFPSSVLAKSNPGSYRWRRDFIRTYLERDVPQFASRIPAETLRRLWTMLAHLQSSPLNVASLSRSLGIDVKTVNTYLDLLVDLLLLRRLPPWHANIGKRLAKTPKVYVRDSGLLHALLDIPDEEALLGHPVLGGSWEGFVIEQIAALVGDKATLHYYRSNGGAEIDCLLTFADERQIAIEIKRTLSPKLSRGFHSAVADLQPARQCLVYPGDERYRLSEVAEALPLSQLADYLNKA
jgi:uncharacterized protein